MSIRAGAGLEQMWVPVSVIPRSQTFITSRFGSGCSHTGKKWDKNLLDSSLQDIPEDQSFGKLQEFCFEAHMCLFPWINWNTLVGKQEKRKSGAQSLQNLCIETPVPPGEPKISGFKG